MKNWYDFIVVGSGIAGLSFARKVADHGSTIVLTKKEATESNTNYAQGGIASVMSAEDSFEDHLRDTLSAGAGLCHADVVEKVIKQGPACIQELMDLGVQFTRNEKANTLSLGREGGHTHNRVVHAADLTGREIERALLSACEKHPNITIEVNKLAVDLLSYVRNGTLACGGVYIFDPETEKITTVRSAITMVATGGVGQVYRYTTNPKIATGGGIAMAYRAGASVANLEFMQFHPTTLSLIGKPPFLISEAIRGEGGILRDSQSKAFMENYHEMKDLAPRDIVARAIDTELKESGEDTVFLDLTHLNAQHIKERFPNIYIHCLENGIDITRDQIPVVPAAHYMCGGVISDINGKTDIARLFVAGETACTGMHGANRLASNSLLEAVVMAHFAARESVSRLQSNTLIDQPKSTPPAYPERKLPYERVHMAHNWREIKRIMWDYVGIVRSNGRLKEASRRIRLIRVSIDRYYRTHRPSYQLLELRDMALVASLMVEAASRRKESRGLHYNIHHPERDDVNWKRDTVLRREMKRVRQS